MDSAEVLRGCIEVLEEVAEARCDARIMVVIAALERIVDEVDEMVESDSRK